MQHNIRLMHIYRKIRKCVQNPSSQLCIDLHGFHRKIFIRTAGMNLEGFCLLPIHMAHVVQNLLCQSLRSPVLRNYNRAYPDDTEHPLQGADCFLIIKCAFRLHIDTSLFLRNPERAVYAA